MKFKVLYKERCAGVLEAIGSGTRFVYSDDWHEDLACTLPVYQRVHEWNDGLHPFFDNLCSEGVLRSRQIKAVNLRDDDSLGLLAKFGADCIGAVGVAAEDDHEQTQELGDDPKMLTELVPHKTVSGVHDKELAYKKDGKFYVSTINDPASYIAKLYTDKLEELLFNESFTLSLAQEVLGKQRVTSFEKAFLHKDKPAALLIKRFDRTKDQQKLRMEDFAQILNVPSKQKYVGSYEEIAESIDKYSAQPQIDKVHFFQLMVFNCLVGNTDAHLKNFSLLEVDGQMRLSPAYDLINGYIYVHSNGYQGDLALRMCDKKLNCESVNHEVLREFGRNISLNERAIIGSIKTITERVAKSTKIKELSKSHMEPGDFKSKYKEIVGNACVRILDQ